ncbi:unnamed protein product [Phytophthora fragariaefolia]|uniref:Unnamed protein product n=1 Tax=Phytophthora fragariaefolia TaxID=1490495 RepID=A0A9W7D7B1_9STRA|nr:unnamed protein product [Phytophthora fragariaefolia]
MILFGRVTFEPLILTLGLHNYIGGHVCKEKSVNGSEAVRGAVVGNETTRSYTTFEEYSGRRGCRPMGARCSGAFPLSDGGERYVIAAVEYVTGYAVATVVKQHTAPQVAAFLMKEVVLRFGPFREILTDGPELTGQVIDELEMML